MFSDEEIKKLKEAFYHLDADGGGSIGVDELENPLIGLGLAANTEEVTKMVKDVDANRSGEVEFNEFLNIIINGKNSSNPTDKFFKELANGKIGKKDLNFAINV